MTVTFTGRDLAKIGLPMQIIGAAMMVLGYAGAFWLYWLSPLIPAGMAAHFVGDTLFFFQMKKQGCL